MKTTLYILAFICVCASHGISEEPTPPPLPEVSNADIQKIKAAIPSASEVATPKKPRKLLVFYRSANPKIHPMGIGNKMFELLAEKTGAFTVSFSQDYADLKLEKLKQYDAVFFNNSGMLKFSDSSIPQDLVDFVRSGKGFAGQHWASDNFRDRPEISKHLFGAVMNGHPFYESTVKNEAQSNPLTAMFPNDGFAYNEETYIFSDIDHRSEPNFKQTYDRSNLQVLLSIDFEKSPKVQETIKKIDADPSNKMYHGKMRSDKDYALSWIRKEGEGRVFYTTFGHSDFIYWNPAMVRHIMAGTQYALGDIEVDFNPKPAP